METPTGLFVRLEVAWVDHEKIISAGVDGAGLHVIAMCLAKRSDTDGWLPRALLARYGATDELLDRLVQLRLLEPDDDGTRLRPWGWLRRNPSQDAIAARRASKSEAGRRGNHARHGHGGPFEACTTCHPPTENGRSSQGATASARTAIRSDRTPSPESESESETDPSSISDSVHHPTDKPNDDEQPPPGEHRPDADRHAAIVDQIVDLRLARRPDTATEIRDLDRWRRSVAEAVRTDHGEAIWHQLHTDATATDQAIADRLEPAQHATVPLGESRHPAVVAQQRTDATREPDGPPASPEAVRRLKAAALSGLASTRTLAAVPDLEGEGQ